MSVTVKIKETGKIETLAITDKNGVEWSADLIGNAGGFIDPEYERNDDGEEYQGIVTQDWYDWWKRHIENYNEMESELSKFAYELNNVDDMDFDKAQEIIQDCKSVYGDSDDGWGPDNVMSKISDYRDELGIIENIKMDYSKENKEKLGKWIQDHTDDNDDRFYKIHYIRYNTEYSTGKYYKKSDAKADLKNY